MKLEKAIEIKVQWRKDNYPPPLADEMNADTLSIEALKRIQYLRFHGYQSDNLTLPGETDDIKRGMTETMFINPEKD
ncbi:hypothetical protein ES703_01241 [subsurface metagenome]